MLIKLWICLQGLPFFHLRFYLQSNLPSFDFQQFTGSNVAKVDSVEEALKTDFDEHIIQKTTDENEEAYVPGRFDMTTVRFQVSVVMIFKLRIVYLFYIHLYFIY